MFLPKKLSWWFQEKLYCWKVRWVLWYHMSNKLLSLEKFAHHVMLLFFLFRDEKQLLSGCPPLHQNKLQEQGLQDVVNRNKIKFKPYGDLVDQTFSQFNEKLTIKTHLAKWKMMEHQKHNMPMKMIQKAQKQTKLL